MPLEPRLFDRLLEFLLQNFEITTFNKIGDPCEKPKVILSFDDGYKDFFEIACPALKKYSLSVNQNVIPECVEKCLPPLNVIAQDFIGRAPKEMVSNLKIPGFANVQGNRLGSRISLYLKTKSRIEQERLSEVLLPQFYAWDGFVPTKVMSLEEIKEISQVHELGAHSYSHASMEYETDEYLRSDLMRCRQYFEEVIGQPMLIYAFPNGSYRREQLEIVAQSGVQHVLLVDEDFAGGGSPHRRFTFNAATSAEVRFKALGGLKTP